MKQQFFKLYLIITVSLIALVLAFGQLYNQFFSEHIPSVQISVAELAQIAEQKETRISSFNQNELVLPDSLQAKFDKDGIISVTENNQQYIYLKGNNGSIQKVGPISLISQAKTDWLAFFAFYFLLGSMILLFIRPVFRDLSLLQRAAHRFSKKPQRIELDIKPNSSIAPLAAPSPICLSASISLFSYIMTYRVLFLMKFALPLPVCDLLCRLPIWNLKKVAK